MKSRTVFSILGGCLLVVILGVAGAVVLWRVASRKISDAVDANMHDPAERERIARKLLRADKLPQGYYPVSGVFSIPLIVHVRLSDRKPDAQGSVTGYDRSGLIYTEAPWTSSSEKTAEFFRGEGDSYLHHVGVNVSRSEVLGRGSVDNIDYTTIRGHLSEGDSTYGGPITLMLVKCSEKKERTMVWFGPDVADRERIGAIMAHFALCKRKP
jgi:hypothetical protein